MVAFIALSAVYFFASLWCVTDIEAEPASGRFALGAHVALNANVMVDASVGALAYFGVSAQLLGLAHLAAPTRGFPVAAQGFGGVAVPLVQSDVWRLTLDAVADVGVVALNGATLATVGILCGPRLVHRSGLTLAAKLPLFGYAGSPQAGRGGVLYFYVASLIAVPVLSFGFSF